MALKWGTRIGEFTPLGFLLGFVICFFVFWSIFHRLPFGTIPAETIPQAVTVRDVEGLTVRLKSDEQSITDLQKKVTCLESAIQQNKKRGSGVIAKCD